MWGREELFGRRNGYFSMGFLVVVDEESAINKGRVFVDQRRIFLARGQLFLDQKRFLLD